MKPIINKDTCIGCGLCVVICPICFLMQDDGKVGVIVDEVPVNYEDLIRQAETGCPVNAMHIE